MAESGASFSGERISGGWIFEVLDPDGVNDKAGHEDPAGL